MAVTVADINGRLIQFLGSSGSSGTSIDLSVVQVNTVLLANPQWKSWLPIFCFLTRFSTGGGPVPTATVSMGTATPAVPVDFKAGAALASVGPTQVFVVLRTASAYTGTNNFYVAVTAGAAGTCDAELYGVVEY